MKTKDHFLRPRSKAFGVLVSLVLWAVVGGVDYVAGFEVSVIVFYLLPIASATWFVGREFAWAVAALCVLGWLVGDQIAGVTYSSAMVPYWNALFTFLFFVIIVWLLSHLQTLIMHLEENVRQRTMALTKQIAERTVLERRLIEISEREQQRIGHELHDSICQHLTATALAGQVLVEKLALQNSPQTTDAQNITGLVQRAGDLARNLAKGLFPSEMEGEDLITAFRQMALGFAEQFGISCRFENYVTVRINNPTISMHVYRIAQEAIRNAIKHGKAQHITIRLATRGRRVNLLIKDDGAGWDCSNNRRDGMGLRIMAHRAELIDASFRIRSSPGKGALMACSFPISKANSPS